MIQTKFRLFLEKLIENTVHGSIDWKVNTKDSSSFLCELKHNIRVHVSVINMGNSKEIIFSIDRDNRQVNVNLAPTGGEIDKLIIDLFETVYLKELNYGLSVIEGKIKDSDKKTIDEIDIIKDVFDKEKSINH